MIDGKLRQMVERIHEENPIYDNHTEIIRDALLEGLNQIIKK